MALPAVEKKKIPPKPQPPQKKKKKNAPDKPQPAWLFPPDDENPVLNPKSKSAEELIREKQERSSALEYMKRRVHAVPDRPAPPPELLTLVGIFLTDFGFNSTSRLFTNERKARTTLNGWEDGAIDRKIEKGTPTLEHIYREWYREWKVKKDDTSSSESESESEKSDSESEAGVTTQVRGTQSSDDDSEASSDGLVGSDVEPRKISKLKPKKAKATKKSSVSSSSASSSSDSDADDEDEKKVNTKSAAASKKGKSQPETVPAKPAVGAMINNLKRKAPASDSSDLESSSEDERPALAKKVKTSASTATTDASVPNGVIESTSSSSSESEDESETELVDTAQAKVESDSDSNSSESSESNSSSEDEVKENKKTGKTANSLPTSATAASDSSATVNGEVKKPVISTSRSDSSSEESSSESDSAPAQKVVPKKKHQGAKLTPLAELSAKGIDNHVSNQYQSYEYADRAYKDLSVTRGKGFTKEKNKKKRGSYRGGAIDTSGGKGFKFED